MENKALDQKLSTYREGHHRRKLWQRIVSGLSAVTVFCASYALILPALTMVNDDVVNCGMVEHKHTDECYEITTQQVLACGLEESAGHTHGDGCFDAEGNLICELPESEGHTHTDACMQEQEVRTLICELPEHEHDMNCFADEQYVEKEHYTCGYDYEHTHTDACWQGDSLICTLTEHTHTDECKMDRTVDTESAADWSESVAGVELTDDFAANVAAVAETQLGYHESDENRITDEQGQPKGYTRYGAWLGDDYADWNAPFCSFCLYYAGVTDFDPAADALQLLQQFEEKELLRDASEQPAAGEIAFLDTDGDGEADRVGVITKVFDDRFVTIEGDLADSVGNREYLLSDPAIVGFGMIPETAAEETSEEEDLLLSTDTSKGYWIPVDEIENVSGAYYAITSGSYALGITRSGTSSYSFTGTQFTKKEVSGYEDYYQFELSSAYQWTFSAAGNSSKQTISAGTGTSAYTRGIRLNNSTATQGSTTDATTNTLTYDDDAETWTISYNNNGTTYYLNYANGTVSRARNANNGHFVIYKFVTELPYSVVAISGGLEGLGTYSYNVPKGRRLIDVKDFPGLPEFHPAGYEFLNKYADDEGNEISKDDLPNKVFSTCNVYNYKALWKRVCGITFDLGDQKDFIEPIKPLNVDYGTEVTVEQLPTPLYINPEYGRPFLGWFTNPECTNAYTTRVLTNDLPLYAKFGSTDDAYYVHFCDYPAKTTYDVILATTIVGEGQTITEYDLSAVAPPKGYDFDGKWYLDRDCTRPFDFSKPVSSYDEGKDVKLWPGANKVNRVAFVTEGSRIPPVNVIEGETIKLYVPERIPTRIGYTFEGWYKDAEHTKRIPEAESEQTITEDPTIFYAGWTPGYVPFTPILSTENASNYEFTSAENLASSGYWYAMAGSTIVVKTTGTTHAVWSLGIDGVEYKVYTQDPNTTPNPKQATLDDVYQSFFIFCDLNTTEWNTYLAESGRTTERPYSDAIIVPSEDKKTVITFNYLRVRMDLQFNLSPGTEKSGTTPTLNTYGYLDIYTLVRSGSLVGRITSGAAQAGNYNATGTFANGKKWEYTTDTQQSKSSVESNPRFTQATFTVKSVKYDEYVPSVWPEPVWVTELPNATRVNYDCGAWKWVDTTTTGSSNVRHGQQSSNVVSFSTDYLLNKGASAQTSGRNTKPVPFYADFNVQYEIAILYAFEKLPEDKRETDFTVGGVAYMLDDDFSQLAYTGGGYSAKQITGCHDGTTVFVKNESSHNITNETVNRNIVAAKIAARPTIFKDADGNPLTLNQIDGCYVFVYRRIQNKLNFNLNYDPTGGTTPYMEEYSILYGQNISDYRYGKPDYEKHDFLTRTGWNFIGWEDQYGVLYKDERWDDLVVQFSNTSSAVQFTAVWDPVQGAMVEFYESVYSTSPLKPVRTIYNGDTMPCPTDVHPDMGWEWTNNDTGQKMPYLGDIPLYGEYGEWVPQYIHEDGTIDSRWVIRIYGKWKDNDVTAVYDANVARGGVQDDAPIDTNHYSFDPAEPNAILRVMSLIEGKNTQNRVFAGWKLSGNGVVYHPDDHVAVQFKPMTFLAQWVDSSMAVWLKYDPNGGTPEHTYPVTKYEDGYAYMANAHAYVWDNTTMVSEVQTPYYTKENYVFSGWNTAPDGSGTTYAAGDTLVLTEPKTTLYALWTPVQSTLTVTAEAPGHEAGELTFTFTATATEGQFLPPSAGSEYTLDETGTVATFTLKNGSSIVLNVQANSVITVTEENADGYYVKVNDGTSVYNAPQHTITVEDEATLTFTNTTQSMLPMTGGTGTPKLYALGAASLITAGYVFLLTVVRRKKKQA